MITKERIAAAMLMGPDEDTDGLMFLWTTDSWKIYDIVQITEVDEGEVLGFVVFDARGQVVLMFSPPEK